MIQSAGRLIGMETPGLFEESHDEAFRTALTRRAQARRDEFLTALQERQRLEQMIERLRRNIETLNLLLKDEGLPPVDVHIGPERARVPFAAPGNRSTSMPPRRERFATMSLPDAVDMVLDENGEMHADEIVRAIFDVQDNEGFKAAKQNLGSSLSRKAIEGRWQRADKPNTYRPNPKNSVTIQAGTVR